MNESQEQVRRISFRDLLTIFFSKLHVFLGILITIIVVTMGVAFFTDPIYKVTGNILVKPLLEQSVKLMAPPATQMSTQPVRIQDITSEVSILRIPPVAEHGGQGTGSDQRGKAEKPPLPSGDFMYWTRATS